MTTILSNGHYMIADKRSTKATQIVTDPRLTSRYEGFKYERPRLRGYVDSVGKIIPLPKTTYKDQKVLALSASGSADAFIEVYNYLAEMSIDALIRVRHRSNIQMPYIQLMFVTEDFHTHRAAFTSANKSALFVNETTYKPGQLVGIGSGASLVMELQERFDNVFDKSDISDVFMLGVNSDSGSSTVHDLYDVRGNVLTTKIKKTAEVVSEMARRAVAAVDFGLPSKGTKERDLS